MCNGFHQNHTRQRHWRTDQRVKRAVFKIQRKDPIQRQQAGQQRPHPKDARRNTRQQLCFRANAKRHQNHDHQEERKAKLHLNGPAIGGPETDQTNVDDLLAMDQDAIDALFD